MSIFVCRFCGKYYEQLPDLACQCGMWAFVEITDTQEHPQVEQKPSKRRKKEQPQDACL